mmetsp:Transcript_26601/g.30736  ORF Transcript_26601/g.30736 Transcript_26601/m.30736 type:complete len:200 (-) Transcript_26601:394-993(-)
MIDVQKFLPHSMYSKYEELDLPKFPLKLGGNERDVFITLNLCRASPVFFINNFVEPIRRRYFKTSNYKDFTNVVKVTHEGLEAVDNLIDFMSSVDKAPVLTWDQDLADIAQANIPNVKIDTETSIKHSNLSNIDFSEFGINPNIKIYELVEAGSTIGFEAFTRCMIADGNFDQQNMNVVMDQGHAYVGVAYQENNNEHG